jgi:hypothetical protein
MPKKLDRNKILATISQCSKYTFKIGAMAERESKLNRFERLAEKRVTEAIKKLWLVGNLANRHNYEYSEEHVRQICDTLDTELRHLKLRFKEQDNQPKRSFRFRKENKKK